MTTDDLLKQGIAALNAGQKAEARRLLMQVVQHDERNEMGWLWLSGAVDTDEDRCICLENVLTINPNNGTAQRGLEALRKNSPGLGSTSDAAFHKDEATLQPIGETKTGVKFQPTREEITTSEINEILQQAVAAIKSGEKERGKQLLIEVIERDENNEIAWLWMTRCATERGVKRECFERVLEINPGNELAQKGLRQLDTLGKDKPSLRTAAPRAKRPKKKRRPEKKFSRRTAKTSHERDVQISEGTKKCPYCAEIIKAEAVICRYCGRSLMAPRAEKPRQKPRSRTLSLFLIVCAIAICGCCAVTRWGTNLDTPAFTTRTPSLASITDSIRAEIESNLRSCCPGTGLRGQGVRIEGRKLSVMTSLDRSDLEEFYGALGTIHDAIAQIAPDVDIITVEDITGQQITVKMLDLIAYRDGQMTWREYRNTWKIVNP